jgi:hypothetical protein
MARHHSEPVQQNATGLSVARTLSSDLWVGLDRFDFGGDGVKEVGAEPWTPALVPMDGVPEFLRGRFAEA